MLINTIRIQCIWKTVDKYDCWYANQIEFNVQLSELTRKFVCYIHFMTLCYKNHSQKYIFNIIAIGISLKIAHVRVEKWEFDKFRRKFVAYFSHADSSMTHKNFSKSHDFARLFSISAEKSASISCLSLCFCVFHFSVGRKLCESIVKSEHFT